MTERAVFRITQGKGLAVGRGGSINLAWQSACRRIPAVLPHVARGPRACDYCARVALMLRYAGAPGALPSWFPEVLAYFRIDRRMDSLSHQLPRPRAKMFYGKNQ
jgi:hypothetical protein